MTHLRPLKNEMVAIFNEYRVQIMSPAYEADPAAPKRVPHEQWYVAPARPPVAAVGSPSARPQQPEESR